MLQKIIVFNVLFFYGVLSAHTHNKNKIHIQRCFWANYYHFKGNTKDATLWFSRLFSAQVPSICHASYIHFLFDTKDFSKIYTLKDLIEKEFSSDISLQLLLAQVLTMYGQEHTIHQNLIELNKKHPEHPELTLYAVQIFSNKKEFEQAILCIDNFLNKSTRLPNMFLFHFSKAQLYVQLNNFALALESAQYAMELFPYFDKTWLMLGLLYEQVGQIEEAIHAYQKYLTMTLKPVKEFEQRVMVLALQQKMLKTSIEKKIDGVTDVLKIAKEFYKKKAYNEALRHIDLVLTQESSLESKLLKIDILLAQNRHKTAVTYIQELLKEDMHNLVLLNKLHDIALTHSCIPVVIKSLKKSLQEKEITIVYAYLADLCLRSEEYSAAIRYLEEAKKNTTEIAHHNAICFQLALLYHQQGEKEKIKVTLEEALKKDENCDYIANFFAYYYAKYEKKFDLALEYIEKALLVAPDNPHYVDTQAFIVYKQGDFQKAEIILEKIIKDNKHDPFINLHYAKVLLKQKKYAATKELLQHINQESFPQHFLEKTKKIQNQLEICNNT